MPPRTKKTAVNPAEGDGPKPEADIAPTNDTKRKRTTKPAVKEDSSDAEPSKPKKPRAAKKPKVDPFHADTLAAHPPRIGTTTSVPMTHIIGAHTSTSGGPEFALVNASELGANALAMFLKNQRRWESKGFDEASMECWKRMMKAREEGGLGYDPNYILPHGSYLINLGQPDATKRETSYKCFLDDLQRCEQLGIKLYNWHPGSTVGACTKSEALKNVADSINRAHEETTSVVCVIENMAGAGNVLGSTFEELAEIIEQVTDKDRVGVCIDTCHTFAAGYDLRTQETYEKTMDEFERIVGFKYLKGMHLNDSQGGGLACHKDRHENIGLGEIGLACFRLIVRDPRLAHIPLILETPTVEETSVWRREIEILYELQHVDGSEEEVTAKLQEMTDAWKTELAEMRRVSGKGPKEKKAPAAKGKKGKKAEPEEGDGDEEVPELVPVKPKGKATAAAKPKATGRKRGRAVANDEKDEELEHGSGTDTSELTEEEA
ncbi:DNA-(apurinic or apyrimidinic site) lyase [Naganishia albida]|nr:DNA-(apurinic or apyrimidinic site) lyase [Naganishia albida]